MPESEHTSRALLARWARISLRSKGVAVLAVPIAALFVVLVSIYWVEGDVRGADLLVIHHYDTRAELARLRSSLLDAETAARGYAATRDRQFYSSFESARGDIQASLARLSSLLDGRTADRQVFETINRLSTEELRLLEPAGETNSGRALSADSGAMTAIQAHIDLFVGDQERRFYQARYDRDLKRQRLFRTVVICGILGPLGTLFVHLLVAGRLVRRIQAVRENARRLAHGLPLEPFAPHNDEIGEVARQIEDAAYLLRVRESALSESERRYRQLFDQAPIPYEETDSGGVIRRFNQAVCALLRRPADRILGRRAWDFVASEQLEAFRDAMLERIRTGVESGPFECEYMLEDGSRVAVEVRETFLRDASGEVTGVCRSLLDVTERNVAAMAARKVEEYALELRNRNEQLARALTAARSATEAKGRFFAGVSHELRTPLNGIIGFSELMQDGRVGRLSPEQHECIGDILSSARHLLGLINDILDLSRIEAGKLVFRPEACNIRTLVEEVRDVVWPLVERKGIELTADLPAALEAVIDPGRFKQILYNYLSNAVKFTPPGGRVEIRVSFAAEGLFRLEVEDTGIGIEPSEVGQLFQEFQQLPNSRKAEQGTGLGLALTRNIVEAQGGHVSVRSTPGKGSVFSAVLPLQSAGSAAAAGR
jgi:PAS domain S-box-containing protein